MDDLIVAAARQGFNVYQRPNDGRWVMRREGIYVVVGETPEGLKALTEFFAALRAAGMRLPI
ncbi:hypothetical protein OG563_26605 [Nocardia vinacea]|uniref:SPOR domain-containing protein n=1 Tax=Nocardia vinacea TaxID=96468 RepID=A0ABZ1YLL5_9NOCA|nr:hypothetical protein [Nocardia vinacea]